MERVELIERLVLNEICDDYENIDQIIFPTVAEVSPKLGITVGRSDIVEALSRLISKGLAKACILSTSPPFETEIEGMPNCDQVEENFKTYFTCTDEGMKLQLSDDSWWPFDEEGNPI